MKCSTTLKWVSKAALWATRSLFALTGGLLTFLAHQLAKPEQLSRGAQQIIHLAVQHLLLALLIFTGFLILLSAAHLGAGLMHRICVLQNELPHCCFVFCKSLKPSDLDIEEYQEEYTRKGEFFIAGDNLRLVDKVILLGRSPIGKTRMAFELARSVHNHWVLSLRPYFSEWRRVKLPYIPFLYRPRVIWVVQPTLGRGPESQMQQYVGARRPTPIAYCWEYQRLARQNTTEGCTGLGLHGRDNGPRGRCYGLSRCSLLPR